jgi:hypothetical protein
MAAHLTRVTVNGFKKCCTSSTGDELMIVCCGMALKRVGMLGLSVREMKVLTVKMETVTLIGKVDRIWHTFVLSV